MERRKETLSHRTVTLVAGLVVLALADVDGHAEMYRWTDAHGELHASQTPPPGQSNNKAQPVRQDPQRAYLDFMETYDRKYKTAAAAERIALNQERQRLAREASASLQSRSRNEISSAAFGTPSEHESLGSREFRQARWALREAERDARRATGLEKEMKEAEVVRRKQAYRDTLTRTSKEDQAQALRMEQQEQYRQP